MRVITGSAKGKKLMTPKDDRVRPTSDKIKQSLFNIIHSMIDDAVFIDLFSGSGAIGIEALSRGAKKAYFLDNHRDSIQLIRTNLELTRLVDRGEVLFANVESGLSSLAQRGIIADVIFMDPPYKLDIIPKLVQQISESKILKENGVIICEHDKSCHLEQEIHDFTMIDSRAYGSTVMTYYQR